jgi:hypothetical protein
MSLRNTSPTEDVYVLREHLPWMPRSARFMVPSEDANPSLVVEGIGYIMATFGPPVTDSKLRLGPGEEIEGLANIGHWLTERAEKLVREAKSEVKLEGIGVDGSVVVVGPDYDDEDFSTWSSRRGYRAVSSDRTEEGAETAP